MSIASRRRPLSALVATGVGIAIVGLAPAAALGQVPQRTKQPVVVGEPATDLHAEHDADPWHEREVDAAAEVVRQGDPEARWAYGTQYIFPLTRGLEYEGVPEWGRYALLPVTVALDIVQLPAGLVGGLFGD